MRRVAAAAACDVRLQIRYGLYGVSVLMVLVWGALLGILSSRVTLRPELLVPPFIVINLQVTTFFFMAALVLFEKSEGVLTALVVSPLRDMEYLMSKSITLTALATAETLLIAAFLFGGDVHWRGAIVASILLGVLYTLAGFITVVRFESINQFLLPSVLVITASMLPLLAHFGVAGHHWMILHPVEPALLVARGDGGAGALAGAIAWCVAAAVWARREFRRFVVKA